jgi:hypothetical protein
MTAVAPFDGLKVDSSGVSYVTAYERVALKEAIEMTIAFQLEIPSAGLVRSADDETQSETVHAE